MRLHTFHQKARLTAASAIDQLRNILAKSADGTATQQLDLSELEDRILLSASPVAVVVESVSSGDSAETAAPLEMKSDSLFETVQLATPAASSGEDELGSAADQDFLTLDSALDESAIQTSAPIEKVATEVVFLDEAAADFEQLVVDLQAQRDAGRAVDFFVLGAHSDGVDQIAETLERYSDLDAVHIVSHGESGSVKLGGTWLRIGSLDGYAGAIAGWGSAFSSDGDILFYGCDLASNTRGEMLVHSIAALTGADVAASNDDTGHATFGGDWELEYETGSVESEVVFTELTQQEWVGKLAVINVTTTDDVIDSGDGLTSLREAIIQSNMGSGGDTISLSAGTYTLSIGGTGENDAAEGDLDIQESVTISGAGQNLTIINGNGIDRVFEVRDSSNFTIEDLTVSGGSTSDDGAGVEAKDAGSFTAARVIFTGNAAGKEGGAIHASNDPVTLTDVAIVGNSAATSGGGLRAEGVTTLTRVTVSGNSATDGAGIYQKGGASDFTLVNVTISGNVASGEGGGIWTDHPMSVTNSTIAFNMGNTGAGLYIHGNNSGLTLRNSILANNTQFDSQADNVSTNNGGTLISSGFNIDSDGTGGLSGTGDQSGVDPLLNPTLSLNGGTTETHALQAGSPAINAGTTTGVPATDQRGVTRDANPDIGAYEVEATTLQPTGEFLVNNATGNTQETSGENRGSTRAVAIAPNGEYVVVWSSNQNSGSDGDGFGVRMQRFDASGNEIGSEQQVNETTSNNQHHATVAVDSSGRGVVAWTNDVSGPGVRARLFNADSSFNGAEFTVNTTASGDQDNSAVAMDAAGNFVIVWEGNGPGDSSGIFAQRFNATGAKVGSEIRVNNTTSGTQSEPAVAMNDSGQFAVVWDDDGGVHARTYEADGTGGSGSQFNVDNGSSAGEADVGIDDAGRLFVVWQETNGIFGKGVYHRVFDFGGSALTSVTTVNSQILNDQTNPSIAVDSVGNHIVAWEGAGFTDSSGVMFQKYDSSNVKIGFETAINQTTSNTQDQVSLAMLDSDNFVVVWSGEGPGDSSGVFARQYGTAASLNSIPTADAGGVYAINEGDALNLDGSASSDPDTDPLTYMWDLDNDGNFGEPGEPTTETPTVDWATLQTYGIDDDGVYTIGLRVDDGRGGSDTTTTTLTVNNVAPTLNTTGTGSATAGGSYTLNLSAVDDGDDTITSWTINWGDGSIETFAGNPASVTHTYATAGFTYNILASATDEDSTYLQNELIVAAYSGDSIFRFAATTGAFLQEFATSEGLNNPVDAVVGPDGNLYVSGDLSGDVLRYNAQTGAFIDEFIPAGTAGISNAEGLAFGPDGNLYVADYSNDRVMRFDGDSGAFIDNFVTNGSGGLNTPYGLLFGPDENLYVNSFTDDNVLRFDGSSGAFIDEFVAAGSGGLDAPEEMTFGPDGNLYVASTNTDSVLRFDGTSGAFIDEFIPSGSGGLDRPAGLTFGPDGNLYVADNQHSAIHRYNGTNGSFIDLYVAPGAGGLTGPAFIEFLPEHQVSVGFAPNAVDDAFAVDEGATLNVSVTPNWFNSNWSFRQELSLDNSAQASDLIDHPILVKLHASAGDATNVDYSQIQDAGEDLRFVDGDGTVLAHEIELWNEAGYSYIWVNVPQIDGASSSDFISMYYGNATADDGQSATSVWNSGERAVLHMNGFTTDSSSFDNDGAVNNAFDANGIIAGAALFDGVDGDVNLGSDSSIDDIFAGGGTISAWINPASLGEGGFGRIADKANTSFGPNGDGWAFQVGGSGYLRFEHGFSSDFGAWRTSTGTVSLDTWQHVVITFDASSASNDPRFFINGVEQTVTQLQAPSGSARSDAALDLKIGNRSTTSTRTFDGLIDEVRISDGLTNSDEVAAQYDNVVGNIVSSIGVVSGPDGLLDNDSDGDSDALTVSIVTPPSHATSFTLNADGSFSYEHDGSEFTTDSFVYQVDDGQGGTDTATVNLTINPQNDPPTDISLSNSNVNENAAGATIGTLSTADVDPGDTHTYTIDDTRFEVVGGQLRLKAGQSLNFESEPTVPLTISTTDSGMASSNKAFVISVNDLNDSPTDISVNNLAVDENLPGGTIGTVTTTDPDSGDSYTYTVDDTRFEIVGGQLRLRAGQSLDFETEPTVPITITTTDSGTAAFNKAFVVSANDINEAPIVSLSQTSDSLAENTDTSSAIVLASISVTDDALGSNSLTLSGTDATSFEIVGGNLRLKSGTPLDFESQQIYSVTVQVNDPLVGSNPDDSVNFTLTITDVDESPVVMTSGGTAAFTEDAGAVSVDSGLTVSDPENVGLVSAEVRFDSGFVAGQDDLLFTNQSGISGSYNPTSGILTLSGTAPVTAYETAVRSVTYSNSSQNPNTGNRVLRFTVNDGLNIGTATRTLTVTAQDDSANVVTGGPYSVPEGSSVTLDGSASSDVDNSIVEYAWDFDYDGVTFSADATGSTTNFSAATIDGPGTRTIALRVRSDNGVFELATTTVTISNVAPTANADFGTGFSTGEDSAFVTGNVLSNDTDPGPESLTVSSLDTTGTIGQVIDLGDGTFTYDPNGKFESLAPGQSANDTFNYTVTDGVASRVATVTIVIAGANDAPIAADQNVAIDENAALNALVATAAATDVDAGDSVSWSIVSGNTTGAFSINNASGEIRVAKPLELNFEANPSYSLSVRATDDNGGIDTAIIAVSVNDLNETPTANNATLSIAENSASGASVGFATGSDPDAGDALAWSIFGGTTDGAFAINSTTGEVTVANAAALDFETMPSFNLLVETRDGDGLVDTATITVGLTNQNESPVTSDVSFGLPENSANGSVVGSVSATDPDAGDSLTWSIVSGNVAGTFTIDSMNGQLRVANSAALDFETAPTFNLAVQVQDASGASDTAAVTISLANQNEAPTATNAVFAVAEDATSGMSVGIITASDPDAGDTRIWSILSGNTGGAFSLNAATGELSVASPSTLDFETTPTYTLNVQIQDAGGLTDSAVVVVNVSNVNEAPTTTGLSDVAVNEDSADVIIDLKTAFSDAETLSGTLSYSIVGNSNSALFSKTPIIGGNLVLKFAPNANGNAIVAVRATDPQEASVTTAFNVVVAPVSDTPTSTADSYVIFGEQLTVPPVGGVLANDSDPDGDAISALLVSGPANGSLVLLSNGGFTYTPDAEFTGIDTFIYEPFDGTSTGPQRTVVLNVTKAIAPPPPSSSEAASESSESSEAASASESESADQTAETTVEAPLSATDSASSTPAVEAAQAESTPEASSSDEDAEEEIAGAYTVTDSGDNFFGGGSQRLELRDATSLNVRTLAPTRSNTSSTESSERFRNSLRFDGEDLSYLVGTEFIQDLEQVEDSFEFDGTVPEWATGTAVATTASISVGYIMWMLRGGYVLASVLSTMPVWQNIDPLPVLAALDAADADDDDSLETMIERASDEADDSENSGADKTASDAERKDEIV